MMSAVDDRANMKQALIRWVVGAVLIISTVTIVDVCFSLFNNMDGSGEGSEVETEESADSPLIGGE